MKWLPEWGRVQMSACGRYTVQHPTDVQWVAYSIPTYGQPARLGEYFSPEKARERCDQDERELTALRRAG